MGADGTEEAPLQPEPGEPYDYEAAWARTVAETWYSLQRDGNPIHIWKLITAARRAGISREWALRPEATTEETMNAPPMPLPLWANQYLAQVAWRITELAEGRDYRKFWEWSEDWQKNEENRRDYEQGGVSPDTAATRLSAALFFTGKGNNAFVNTKS